MDNRGLYFVFRQNENIVQDFSVLLNYPEKGCLDEEITNIQLTPSEKERLMSLIADIVKRERMEAEVKGVSKNRVLKYFEDDIKDNIMEGRCNI